MGILPRLALIFAVPMGAVGVGRLLKDRASNRARIVGAFAYAAMPVGMNMIGQGRIDVLVVVALLPFIVRRVFEVMDVPGFRTRPYSEPVPFGHRGWRTTEAGQRMVLIMLHRPGDGDGAGRRWSRRGLVVVGVALARLFEPDEREQPFVDRGASSARCSPTWRSFCCP